MPEGLGDTLTQKAGPLPIWSWAVIGVGGLAGIMYYRNKKAAATAAQQDTSGGQSNLGNVPISNLSTAAAPMPFEMGDTFVNVSQPPDNDNPTPPPKTTPPPPGKKPPAGKLPKPKPPGPTPAPGSGTKTVTVCPWPAWCGSLWGIAAHEWGNGNLWQAIYTANKAKIGNNPNLIHVGTVLTIPAKPSQPAAQPNAQGTTSATPMATQSVS